MKIFGTKMMIGTVAVVMTAIATTAFAADVGSFASVLDHLSLSKNTQLHAREYWRTARGQEATWSGEVLDVQGGRKGRAKILVADKAHATYKGYNIVLVTNDVAKAADMTRGQKIRFKGIVKNYTAKDAVVIELSDVQIL